MSKTTVDNPLPRHLQDNPKRLNKLRRFANEMANFYRTPVYLCGSAMIDFNCEPRDWDIRIEMGHRDFKRRFGDPWQWMTEGGTGNWTQLRWKWSDECVKRTKDGWGRTGLNIDFQIYPLVQIQSYAHKPKVRLDTTHWKPMRNEYVNRIEKP